jgi:hypothetical protein
MTKTTFKLVALAWFGLMLSGCSRTHSELGGDSSTHWLLSCKDDAQCGALSCLCGVCSKECSRENQCGALGASASCIPSADGCGEVQLCDRECDLSEDCAGSNLECIEGRCRLSGPNGLDEASAPMSQQDGASPPAPMSDAGAGGAQTSEAGGGGSPGACAPQRAAWDGTECLRPLGFSWNGASCEEVLCGCQGPDCAALFPSEQACELAYAACLNPATQCSGLPWYRCFDHCPGDLHLIGGSRSSGECSGDCSFTLSFEPPPASGSCLSVRGALRVDNTELPARTIHFELGDMALEELMLLSRAIEGLSLAPPDCSDCAPDQGSHAILRRDAESAKGVLFSYPAQRPPSELRAVDRFIQTLIDQASACRGDKLLSCTE